MISNPRPQITPCHHSGDSNSVRIGLEGSDSDFNSVDGLPEPSMKVIGQMVVLRNDIDIGPAGEQGACWRAGEQRSKNSDVWLLSISKSRYQECIL